MLRPDEGHFDTLPLLGLDSEELLHEERTARRAAAVVADLVQRLDPVQFPRPMPYLGRAVEILKGVINGLSRQLG